MQQQALIRILNSCCDGTAVGRRALEKAQLSMQVTLVATNAPQVGTQLFCKTILPFEFRFVSSRILIFIYCSPDFLSILRFRSDCELSLSALGVMRGGAVCSSASEILSLIDVYLYQICKACSPVHNIIVRLIC